VIDAIGQVAARHGLAAASPPDSDDVVWCTTTDDVSLVDDERCDSSDPAPCVDLWVHVDQRRREIAVDFEGRGLHEHLTGTTHWDGADPFPLAGDLDRSLALLAGHIDRWFGAIIQRR